MWQCHISRGQASTILTRNIFGTHRSPRAHLQCCMGENCGLHDQWPFLENHNARPQHWRGAGGRGSRCRGGARQKFYKIRSEIFWTVVLIMWCCCMFCLSANTDPQNERIRANKKLSLHRILLLLQAIIFLVNFVWGGSLKSVILQSPFMCWCVSRAVTPLVAWHHIN